jgi:hypothetical protein
VIRGEIGAAKTPFGMTVKPSGHNLLNRGPGPFLTGFHGENAHNQNGRSTD